VNDFLKKVKKEIESTIAIDFDGVIHKNSKGYHDGSIYDDPVEGTKEALKELSQKYDLVIFTCKARLDRPLVDGETGIELIKEWLIKHGLNTYIKGVSLEKPAATAYIDDKGITFRDWENALLDLKIIEDLKNKDLSRF